MLQRITILGTMATVLAAAPLAAQQAAPDAASDGNAADAATEATAGADVAADAFARAEAAGIPTSLLESKIAEGEAKGVSMARIESAVQQRTDALIAAQDAFTSAGVEQVSTTDLSVGADALQGGVSANVLEAVSASAPQERRSVAIAALTQLVARGQVDADALATVQTALERGPDALANLAADVGVGANAASGNEAGLNAGDTGAGMGAGAAAEGGVETGAGVGVDLP